MRVLQTMENPPHYGPITCLCIDRKRSWIVVGTSTGVLTLWDHRFGLLLKSWHVGIASTGRSVRIYQCVVHPSKGRGKWVMVTMEASKRMNTTTTTTTPTNLVEVWDIEKSVLVETFVSRAGPASPAEDPHEITGVDADTSPAAAIAGLVRSRQAEAGDTSDKKRIRYNKEDQTLPLSPPSPDVRAMVVGLDFGGHSLVHRSNVDIGEGDIGNPNNSRASARAGGFMVTGSEDRRIRLWDLGRLERTVVLSGLESESDKPSFRYVYVSFSRQNARLTDET